MKLYHGTSFAAARSIVQHGLRPRSLQTQPQTKKPKRGERQGNWEKFPSHKACVYLTTAYPVFFAMAASNGDPNWTVVEVDTDLMTDLRFLPDEDFVGQLLAMKHKLRLDLVHNKARKELEQYAHLYKPSLQYLGTCCVMDTIPVSAITGICVIQSDVRKPLTLAMSDNCMNLMNYALKGAAYEAMVQWLFGYRATLPQTEDNPEVYEKFMPGYTAHWQKESSNREGITIHRPSFTDL